MTELEEFAEALMDQLSIEINEEKEIAGLVEKINEDSEFNVKFESIDEASKRILPWAWRKINETMGLETPKIRIEFPELVELKKLKGRKVFTADARDYVDFLFDAIASQDIKKIAELIEKDTAKFLVYSTYAKGYISKISTTYGDYLDDVIYLNKFILDSYPKIILYKQGFPYEQKFETVRSGFEGALKMTILEESIHACQTKLHKINIDAVKKVNQINEELAKIILNLDDPTVAKLSEYLQLQYVPDEFVKAKRANLFFFLNPDHFLVEQLGPDIMTYNRVEIDPKISEMLPELLGIYEKWLEPIQKHHATFTAMEGMAEFAVHSILKEDKDFANYLTTFMGTSLSAYQVRKSIGKEFTTLVYEKFGKDAFSKIMDNPPSTRELKEPQLYLNRIK